jgi:hypothetical protein
MVALAARAEDLRLCLVFREGEENKKFFAAVFTDIFKGGHLDLLYFRKYYVLQYSIGLVKSLYQPPGSQRTQRKPFWLQKA